MKKLKKLFNQMWASFFTFAPPKRYAALLSKDPESDAWKLFLAYLRVNLSREDLSWVQDPNTGIFFQFDDVLVCIAPEELKTLLETAQVYGFEDYFLCLEIDEGQEDNFAAGLPGRYNFSLSNYLQGKTLGELLEERKEKNKKRQQ